LFTSDEINYFNQADKITTDHYSDSCFETETELVVVFLIN